ncbi:3-isopropylmalate dehydrogenase [Kitasatospora sp. MMS16-BH015]|uniref:isocitrate/isopropylmalate family dehydrogenase n=1 Tax=Kitasatospora sp. MMS16-BH015 TaxID=2018025 RepID=UPI000CA0AA32|nr:isocitrate/isopropylmalate family dehydrogenase [Kitasatospora sp. MMS16-BH015]AUG78463.1 3-isopropylmalate dehydrogenase [Kitasatospora sp. MMS16-BH015]
MTPTKKIAVLPGDGIGREVVDAALPVLDVLGAPVELIHGDLGWKCWQREGDPVPARTWELLAATDTALVGAVTSKPPREAEAELDPALRGRGLRYVSPVVQLRQRLGLYANVRPVENHLGRGRPYRFAVIRENTEGLYAGFDYAGAALPGELGTLVGSHPNAAASGPGGSAVSLRLLTRYGLEQLIRYAFEYARANDHTLVTWADKPNVLRESGQFAREVLERVATEYPGITAEVQNVDAVALWLVRRPERFGVIVAENMYGDILSDLGAGVMGGLGLAPSGNIGAAGSYFEPVHGSAPHLAGRDRANPAAMMLTLAMMLDHLGLAEAAREIPRAVRSVLRRGEVLTYDLGGSAGTAETAAAVVAACTDDSREPTAAVLTVGDELLNGDVVDTNASQAGKLLRTHGFRTRARRTVGDGEADISGGVAELLGHDLLVVIGGLGPTSDDRTRQGVAQALGRPLDHSAEAWAAVVERLERFGLVVHPDNERQALFPAGSELLPNENGTAWGSLTDQDGTKVVMLPGPPKECLPMLRTLLERIAPAKPQPEWPRWRTIGLIESDVAAAVDEAIAAEGVARLSPAYRWTYPYVDISLPTRTLPGLEKRISELLDGHVVSRRGRSAGEELAELLAGLSTATVELDDRLTGGRAEKLFGTALRPTQGAAHPVTVRAWAEGEQPEPDRWTGSLAMHCTVETVAGHRDYALVVPRRGPEVFDYAAEFVAWSVLRGLRSLYTPTLGKDH